VTTYSLPDPEFQVAQGPLPRRRGDDPPLAPVARVGPAFHQSRLGQVVDQVGHHRAVDAEVRGESQLAGLFAVDDGSEHLVAAVPLRHRTDDPADLRPVGPQQHTERPAEIPVGGGVDPGGSLHAGNHSRDALLYSPSGGNMFCSAEHELRRRSDMGRVEGKQMLDINLTGVWHTVKAAIPHMLAGGRGGAVILTSSAAGLQAYANIAHYVSAKHGVVGLMRTLAVEYGPQGIRVNSIHPSQVDTPMIQNDETYRLFRPDLENPTAEDFREASSGMHLLPVPWVESQDIANAALFLASDEAHYITGVPLPWMPAPSRSDHPGGRNSGSGRPSPAPPSAGQEP
jgi:NAD(P)-dependent dehydrogenase (short-subunit alcohol dehydrogenase family)